MSSVTLAQFRSYRSLWWTNELDDYAAKGEVSGVRRFGKLEASAMATSTVKNTVRFVVLFFLAYALLFYLPGF